MCQKRLLRSKDWLATVRLSRPRQSRNAALWMPSVSHGWGDAQYFRKLSNAGWKLMVEPRAYVWCEPNTYPPPLHSQGFRQVMRILFADKRHPNNLQRQFAARWHSAPNKFKAAASFGAFLFHLTGKAVKLRIFRRTGQS